ncbi:Phosphatidylinositol 4-phosphate 5-kinase 1 [Hondaea fermentalgiana]|uniref:Phosphatidylinositol 4-phosphate 5-kinase 1 n=1 Tax=Hondaea fermentalgiana TaxID=2315210 RepID=A0A2R5GJK0_9STRA|nr:Phosphatidylinositol 4-phosphate 5-kinase 1 [Hondaea fermentalgiana]|eukprot:GBG31066.1 Phosphatidylinositol 4-phosphate 5-kinase 1 [Hondaea fermentalgiana]
MADAGEEEAAPGYTVHYLDGHKEKTTWVERAGLAVVTYANGDRFEGRFSSHREREGHGRYTWAITDEEGAPTGETATYDGEYRQGKPHGHGAYQFASPKSYLLGQWVEGEFIRGRWAKTDGSAYYGQFQDGQPIHGGLFYNPNGLKQEARYEEAKGGEEDDDAGADENVPLSRALVAGRIEEARAGPGHYTSIVTDPLDSEDFVVCARKLVPEDSGETSPEADSETVQVDELLLALSASESFQQLAEAAPIMCEATLHESVKNIDKDGDGQLSLQEFTDYFYAMKLFALVDADGSKQVRHGELQASLRAHPDLFPSALLASTSSRPTSRIAISGFLSAADNDDDRLLSFDEFLYLLFVSPQQTAAV